MRTKLKSLNVGRSSPSLRVDTVVEPVRTVQSTSRPTTCAVTKNQPLYPGIADVINGDAAVAHVMNHVCGGVIGYPITPSTEFVETFEAEAQEQAALARRGL